VGCGRVAPKSELVRLAVARDARGSRAQRAVIDNSGTLPGRGAYLCRGVDRNDPDGDCLRHALRRGGIARTLRRNVSLDLDPLDRDPEFVELTNRVAQPAAGRRAGSLDLSVTSVAQPAAGRRAGPLDLSKQK
jgi:predicted RNA-binding protein YlxR (DUF448 family)